MDLSMGAEGEELEAKTLNLISEETCQVSRRISPFLVSLKKDTTLSPYSFLE